MCVCVCVCCNAPSIHLDSGIAHLSTGNLCTSNAPPRPNLAAVSATAHRRSTRRFTNAAPTSSPPIPCRRRSQDPLVPFPRVTQARQLKRLPEWQEHGLCCAVVRAGQGQAKVRQNRAIPLQRQNDAWFMRQQRDREFHCAVSGSNDCSLHVSPTCRARDMAKLTESAAGMLMRGRTRARVIGLAKGNSPAMATHRRILPTHLASRERG